MVLERLTSVVRRGGHDAPATQLYASIVRASRNQKLYSAFLVQDTVDGRFDMLALHLFLLQNRVDGEPDGETVMQEVLERFVADMDQNLRQLGVGDPSMGREVRAMVGATHGRFAAYAAGLAGREPGGLETALARNVYRSDDREEEGHRHWPPMSELLPPVSARRRWPISLREDCPHHRWRVGGSKA